MLLRKQGRVLLVNAHYGEFLSASKRLLSGLTDPPSDGGRHEHAIPGGDVSSGCDDDREFRANLDGQRTLIEEACRILKNGCSWGPATENALEVFDGSPKPEVIVGVLRKMDNFEVVFGYFRWVEKKTDQAHCPEAYNALLKVISRTRGFDRLDLILEKMGIAGYGLASDSTIELVVSSLKSGRPKEAFDLIQTMRKFKFRPAFSAYTTLIGALSTVHESDLMLNLFRQMQELGYEVNLHLFTTIIRSFAKEGRVDSALSILGEMKSNSLEADIVLYNVCIDCFGKVGNLDMAWKFFHEMKMRGIMPDEVTYTSITGVLCRANCNAPLSCTCIQ